MLTIGHDVARDAFLDSVTAFATAAGAADDLALLGASRCHGWSRLDVVTHLLAGWHELVGGLATRTAEDPTVDAASYWTAFAAEDQGDPVDLLLAQRRRSDAYGRPSRAVDELHDVARTLGLVVAGLPDGRHRFQGQVLTSGDLLASWAVENAVHHLDLLVDSEAARSADRLRCGW